jgi:hypothetical protein
MGISGDAGYPLPLPQILVFMRIETFSAQIRANKWVAGKIVSRKELEADLGKFRG